MVVVLCKTKSKCPLKHCCIQTGLLGFPGSCPVAATHKYNKTAYNGMQKGLNAITFHTGSCCKQVLFVDKGTAEEYIPHVFPFTTASRTALGPTQPPVQWVPSDLSLRVKRPGREADHSPSSVEVKNVWSYTSTPPCVLLLWNLVKHRGNFALPLPFRRILPRW
jgi:hypothetical protein